MVLYSCQYLYSNTYKQPCKDVQRHASEPQQSRKEEQQGGEGRLKLQSGEETLNRWTVTNSTDGRTDELITAVAGEQVSWRVCCRIIASSGGGGDGQDAAVPSAIATINGGPG